MPRVSVLLPNYNNAPFLKEALDSLFNQTFQDFEIYFVDDCSTDSSLEVVRNYKDDRIKIFTKEQNSGIVDTMNTALDNIETEYFIRMDGDDISTPNRFETLVNYMDAHPEIGVCSSSIQTFGKVKETLKFGEKPEMNKASLLFGHSVGHASSIFRTAVFKENGIRYLDRFWRMEDYDLFYRLKDITLTTSIPDELYLYRREDYNFNQEIFDRKREEFRRFYKMVFEDLGMEFTDKDISLHLQLSKREEPTFQLREYEQHAHKVLNANARSQVFPQAEATEVLKNRLTILIFRMVDAGSIGFFRLIPSFFKTPGLFRHYMKKKVNRIRK